jgi:hypothetical protein
MNANEVARIVRSVKALCPAQKFDEATPDMWLAVLKFTDFNDAKTAIVTLGKTQAFIAPGEIDTEVRRMRNDRIKKLRQPIPNTIPGVDEQDELRAITRAIADGRMASEADLVGYETWGGSLHLAWQAGQYPALEPAVRAANPQAVIDAIAGVFPLRPELPREIAEVINRRRPPGTAIACPVCHAAPNRKCHTPRGRELTHMHPTRLDAWSTAAATCPTCLAIPGKPCTEYGAPYANGAHQARHAAATEGN